ncbi:hypothetical protein HA466_0292400 [Hirschfeldia incana]|nr:hypothetical protein HA466_0292400 [Hirschfeldia incana]
MGKCNCGPEIIQPKKPMTRVSGRGQEEPMDLEDLTGEQPSKSNMVDLREGVKGKLDLLRAVPWTEKKEGKRKKLLVDTREAKPTIAIPPTWLHYFI